MPSVKMLQHLLSVANFAFTYIVLNMSKKERLTLEVKAKPFTIKQRAVSVLIYLSTYIYYCDEQDPERLTNIFFFFFFFTILFSAACHVVLPIKLDQ